MKKFKKYISLFLISLFIINLSTVTYASNSYTSIIDNITNRYGLFKEMYSGSMVAGLMYGDFIDFDNNGTEEMLLIYKDENNENNGFARIEVYAMQNSQLVKVFDKNVYSEVGQTDVSYNINIKQMNNKTYIVANTGFWETITVFTITNNNAECHEYNGDVVIDDMAQLLYYKKCSIDGKNVSDTEYQNTLKNYTNNSKRLFLIPSKQDNYGNEYYCTRSRLLKFINKAKEKDSQLNPITGTIKEIYIQDGMGYDVQCLILTLDKPCNFKATDVVGQAFNAYDVIQMQAVIKNYNSSMDGARIKINSYDDIFEGHTSYHIRDLVMNNATVEILSKPVNVTINGELLSFEQPPVIVDGSTLVPLRKIFEELGANVDWNGETKTITSTKGNITISMTLGKQEMYKNNSLITLDVPPQLFGESTLIPVRAVAEAFNCQVDWDNETRTVFIN